MAKVRLNLRGLSTSIKAAKARQIVTAMTGNPSFTTPTPALTAVTAAATALETAIDDALMARNTAVTKTAMMHDKEEALELILRQLASYVESIAGDDELMILSAGMEVKAPGVASSTPATPAALSATEGDHEGEIDLSWDPVNGAKTYVIERSPDPPIPASWAHETVSLKSSVSVGGLVSGTRYWFRVASMASNGQSGWSDPATKIAP